MDWVTTELPHVDDCIQQNTRTVGGLSCILGKTSRIARPDFVQLDSYNFIGLIQIRLFDSYVYLLFQISKASNDQNYVRIATDGDGLQKLRPCLQNLQIS